MSKISLEDIQTLTNEQSFISRINLNNQAIETASDSFLSRDGTSPNQMTASLDMNSQRIINLPVPLSSNDAARLGDIESHFIEIDEYIDQARDAAEEAEASAEEAQEAAEAAQITVIDTAASDVDEYTALLSDDGKVKYFTFAGEVIVTLPRTLPAAWSCTFINLGSNGYITVTNGSGATVEQPDSMLRSRREKVPLYASCYQNADSNTAKYLIWGDITT